VFGGTVGSGRMTETIEMYLIAANEWIVLEVKLPNQISFVTPFKVSPFQIILMGGLIESESEGRIAYPTN
jgi:hypothetical protein